MRGRALLLVWALSAATQALSAPVVLYVSPERRDTWTGLSPTTNAAGTDGPLASLSGARDRLRQLRAAGELDGPVRVQLQPGSYPLAEPIVFTPQDGGTPEAPVTYAGAPGWASVVSGGKTITGWREVEPGLWVASVPEARGGAWPLRSLYVNGRRAVLARSPNEGYFRIAGKAAPIVDPDGNERDSGKIAFRVKPEDWTGWPDVTGANVMVFYHWETGLLPIQAVDPESATITLTGEMKWPFWSNQRYFVENARAALDAPGEFWLDRQEGLLYYRPRPDEDMGSASVIAPRLTQLVLIEGDVQAGLPVSNLRFEGLSFQHTNYELEPTGHCDWQAAVTVNAAIQANGASDCAIDGCEVAHIGNYAVWFAQGCQGNVVRGCYVHDTSAGGVRLGTGGIPATEPEQTRSNRVTDNLIRDIGHEFPGAVGVWVGQSSDNVIAHNEICDTYYTAISCGWSWGFNPTQCHRNRIEYNYLHDIGRGRLCDEGAIYTLGLQPGAVIRGNLIHDVWDWDEGYGAGGIYPDEGSSGILIENNVVYRTASGGLTVHYGRDLVVRNNIFAFGRDAQIHLGRRDQASTMTFERNIVYFDEGVLMQRDSELVSRNNVYYNTAGEELVFPLDRDWAAWQASGQDQGSIIADPLFVAPEQGDFRLRPESPALKLGFEPIDTSLAGLTGPPELIRLARSIERAPLATPRRPEPPALTLDEGFENTPSGVTAENCITWGEAGAARIRVTDQAAATGRHSLRFEDAPGLDFAYNPHLWYSPHQTSGLARGSFDLRLEPGALFWHEWRDNASPYRVGPSVGVDATGQLKSGDQVLMNVPWGQWIHFEISAGLGKQATGAWDLVVTVPGQAPQRFMDLPCDPRWKALEWMGFISNAEEATVFDLDNVTLKVEKP